MHVHQKLFNDCDAHSEHDSYSFIAAADVYAHVSHHTYDTTQTYVQTEGLRG